MSLQGWVMEVATEPIGTHLYAAASASDTTLSVDYAADFDPDGGVLDIDGTRLTYTGVTSGLLEDDPDTITLAEALSVGFEEQAVVGLVAAGQVATETTASVSLGDGDNVDIVLPYYQRLLWPDGIYEPPVPVMVSDDLMEITEAPGREPVVPASASGIRFHVDTATATGSGNLDVPLTYLPLDEYTPQVFWEPVHLGRDEWTRTGQLVTVTDPGFVADDEVSVHYAYHAVSGAPISPAVTTFAEEVMADNPVLWAQLGESSGTAAADSSGNGNTGAYGGTVSLGQPSLAAGLPGTAVDLGGAGWIDWVPGASWQRPPEFTAEIWCKPTTADGAYVFACDNAGTPGPNRIWSIQPASGARIWHDTSEEIASLGGWSAGDVMMVTLTFDGTTVSAYKNGELIDTEVASLGVMNTSTTHPLCIGAAGASNGDRLLKFDGLVQHALLYDTCLPRHRIAAHYAAGVGA